MSFHSESVDFVMDFCVNFSCGFLGAVLFDGGQNTEKSTAKFPTKSLQNPRM